MKNYRIKDWSIHFENCESKKLKRLMWVPIPNKMHGEGYTFLVDHPNGAAHLGAWLAIVEIASKQEPRENRGNLPAGVNGEISRSLGRISRLPGKIFEEVLPRLLEIGWIEEVQCLQSPTAKSGKSPDASGENPGLAVANRREWNGIEGNRTEETHTQFSGTTQAAPEKPVACVREMPAPKPETAPAPEIPVFSPVRKLEMRKETPASNRFHEWLGAWPACGDRDGACRAWISRVTAADEGAAFLARDRYLASDQVKRGIIQEPKKFITVQADCGWTGTWISDTTQLDPSIAGLKDIERRIKEMDEHDKRNGREKRSIAAAGFTRISETARLSGISASGDGKLA